MAGGKLPTLKDVLGGSPGSAHGGLPTLQQTLGHDQARLPSLKDVLNTPAPAAAPAKSGGHGFLHTLGEVGHTLERGAHFVGQKSELAATDLKNIPGGLIEEGSGIVKDIRDLPKTIVRNTVALPSNPRPGFQTGGAKAAAPEPFARTVRNAKAAAKQAVQTEEHPLRDPFQTLLQNSALVSGGATIPARLAEAGRVIDAGGSFGDVIKAAVKHPPVRPRLLTVNGETTSLHASKNPAVRAVQAIHDHVIQHAIDTNPDSRLAGYGTKRVGGAADETARRQAAMRATPANVLDRASLKLMGPRKRLTGEARLNQAALELTSTQTPPEEAAAFHESQAAAGVNPGRNRAVAKLYRKVAQKGLLTVDDHGAVVVNAVDHPDLAKADVALHTVQGKGDEILARYGVRTAEQLQARVDAPARVRAGATYEKPTPAKLGKESKSVARLKGRVMSLERRYRTALTAAKEKAGPAPMIHTRTGYRAVAQTTAPEKALARQHLEVPAGPKTPGVPSELPVNGTYAPRVQRLGAALSVARDELAAAQKAAEGRVKETGLVGGETARPGRGFVSYKIEEKNAPTSSAAASPGAVVGEARSPITSHVFTGEGVEKGFVPKDVTGPAARNFRQIIRFVNTSERRGQAIRMGSPIKQTRRDVLARLPGVDHDKIPAVVNDILGTSRLTVDDVNGLHAALDDYKQQLIPGLKDRFAQDNQHGIGTPAPAGYVWVDRNLLGELARPGRGPRGVIGRQVDNINSAVTAATVYFKIGHVGTRVLTDAATNIIQGSATPLQIAKSNQLWHALDDTEKARALAATGEHGFTAMPHSGVSLAARVAGKGASWWARHADAPFRFNSLAYEARKAGFDTPEKFRYLLDKLADPAGLDAAQTAKIDWVGKRANREAIAYDRLSTFEKNYLAGAIWFYPWVRATGSFVGNTILEHPYKSALGGTLAKQSEQTQQTELGDLPTYERGLVELAGGDKPLVADFSTFSPFATPADLLDSASVGQVASMLNPVYGGLALAATRQNSFGQHSNSPLSDAASEIFSPTPEAQILTGFLHRHKDQSRRMFPQSPGLAGTETPLLRALIGPAAPRRINPLAAHSAAARERRGR